MKKVKYTKDYIIKVTLEHSKKIQSSHKWNDYAKPAGLPAASTIIKAFGTWNKFKEAIAKSGGELNSLPPASKKWTKEKILSVLEENLFHFSTKRAWDVYAKENNLPRYNTIRNYLTKEELSTLKNR